MMSRVVRKMVLHHYLAERNAARWMMDSRRNLGRSDSTDRQTDNL